MWLPFSSKVRIGLSFQMPTLDVYSFMAVGTVEKSKYTSEGDFKMRNRERE